MVVAASGGRAFLGAEAGSLSSPGMQSSHLSEANETACVTSSECPDPSWSPR